MEKSNKKNLSMTNKLKLEHPRGSGRWLDSNLQFGSLNKLDEMLRHYKSVPDEEPLVPRSCDWNS
jgi:hypothetical protein